MPVKVNLANLKRLQKQIKKLGAVTLKVGVRDDMQYPDGPKVADVAVWQEYGWAQVVTHKQIGWFAGQGIHMPLGSTLHLPPRPVFHATAAANKSKWQVTFQRLVKNKLATAPEQIIMQGMALTGQMVQQDLQDTIINGGAGGQPFARRSPLTMALYAAQAQGHRVQGRNQTTTNKPLYRTGLFAESIAYEIVKGK